MRMPNCRTDEGYNQDMLEGGDRSEIRGYDWCAEEVVDNFFDNDMCDLADPDTHLGHVLCENVPEYMRERYEVEHSFRDKKTEERQVLTYADLIRMKLLEWIESSRNELIVSMIEGKAGEDDE